MLTPITKLDDFYLKREDKNLTGSVKDRAVELQVKHLADKGIKSAVLSSTGNAAISAAFFCRQYDIDLTVFVSPKINPSKLNQISPAHIITSDKAISDAFKYAKDHQSFFLRQSTDPLALVGYSSLSLEIKTQLPQITSIFFPVGSGTTLLGVATKLPLNVAIFAVQPASNPTIVKAFNPDIPIETETITDALSVKMLPLKHDVINIIKKTHGSGIFVTDAQSKEARKFLETHHLDLAPEAALTLAGFFKARTTGLPVGDYPLLVVTGTRRH